jgi:hypothetical protein
MLYQLVIASEAKQSIPPRGTIPGLLRFARNDGIPDLRRRFRFLQ